MQAAVFARSSLASAVTGSRLGIGPYSLNIGHRSRRVSFRSASRVLSHNFFYPE
jgi:hypothetical protein